MRITKSKYVTYCQCEKALWLKANKPELEVVKNEAVFETGTEVGKLARGIFGDYIDVTVKKDDGSLDIGAMLNNTIDEINKGTDVICEAAFSYNDEYYAAVDILRKQDDGYAIYEVKSSTSEEKVQYYQDIAFQKWLLEKCKINVTGTYIICINNEYVFDEKLEIDKLFSINDVSKEIKNYYNVVENESKNALSVINSSNEPNKCISINCFKPYSCGFFDYCTKDKPNPSVFDLYRMNKEKMVELYNRGKVSFENLKNEKLSEKQSVQVNCYLKNTEVIDKGKIKAFLDTLTYPLYFLDFETMQFAIPMYKGTKPYQQIPFQYSLHYRDNINGELKHKEFLAISGEDPRRSLAEQLVKDIPSDKCVLAYNMGFEKGRIKEMAAAFDDLNEHLLKIQDNIKDLLIPFQNIAYYKPSMNGSFSIKSVLPSLFPDDPSLNYHNLENVHNGTEAANLFPKIKDLNIEEQKIARESLLKYCGLDTYAMVKVLDKLYEIVK